jgi:hypothetical protein
MGTGGVDLERVPDTLELSREVHGFLLTFVIRPKISRKAAAGPCFFGV